ncbi:MAG TPA: ABC transporter permease subunit [Pseudonocardiaceae bacterium]|nr:ABC transporter permease subunit [Pseudonocardiaceae bacterium]
MERIKLFSTRSPWWCMGLILAVGVGLAALLAALGGEDFPVSVALTQAGLGLGSFIALVLAAIAITSEYRFGTIRATFTAVPNRTAVLLAKTVVVAVLLGLVGLVTAFAAWGVAYLIDGTPAMVIDSTAEWRAVAGEGLLYAGYAIIALGVGLLVRQTAGAISLLLVWALVVETIIVPILDGALKLDISRWLPFANAGNFITAGDAAAGGQAQGAPVIDYPFGGPWGSLGYFLTVAVALLVIGIVVADRRDA